jgi:predicted transcriptional regulator
LTFGELPLAKKMPVKPLDTLLAIKVINLATGLRASDRRVATALIEHFNRKTGRCDPSLERISFLLELSTRTIMRSIKRLEEAGLFRRIRHGGYFSRNRYEPNWARFNDLERGWRQRFKRGKHDQSTELSATGGQLSHLRGDKIVTQTYRTNLNQLTFAAQRRTITDRLPSNLEAAKVAAERRWTSALHRHFSTLPDVYAAIIEAIDPSLQEAATNIEINDRGAGLTFILEKLEGKGIFE